MELHRIVSFFVGDTTQLEQATTRANRSVQSYVNQSNKQFSSLKSGIDASGTSLLALGARAGALGIVTAGFLKGGSAILQYSQRIEQLKIGFSTLLGSQAAANRHLKELEAFAAKTPFEFEDVARASQRFNALGLAANQVLPMLTAVGNTVAALGGGKDEIDRVSIALTQMVAKQRVMTQELNQLTEVGIPVYRILEQQTGRTRMEISKMVEAGEISSASFLAAFQKFSQNKFGDAMARQSQTMSGALSTLKDNLMSTTREGLDPFFQKLTAITVALANATTKGRTWAQVFSDAAFAQMQMGGGLGAAVDAARAQSPYGVGQSTGFGDVRQSEDKDAQQQRLNDLKAYTEAYIKQYSRLQNELKDADPLKQLSTSLSSQLNTFGDDSALGAAREQIRKWREEIGDLSQYSPEAVKQFNAMSAAILNHAAALDKRSQAAATQGREADVIKQLTQENTALTVQLRDFNKTASEQAYYLELTTLGIDAFTDANKKAAAALLNNRINGQETIRLLESEREQRQALAGIRYDEETQLEKVIRQQAEYNKTLDLIVFKTGTLVPNALNTQIQAFQRLQAAMTDNGQNPLGDIALPYANTGTKVPSEFQGIRDTDDAPAMRMQIQWTEGWRRAADESHNILANFFSDLGQDGKGALANLGLDFANMVQQMATQALAAQLIGKLFGGGGSGDSGGGWLGKLLGFGIKALGGAAGGSIGGGGGFGVTSATGGAGSSSLLGGFNFSGGFRAGGGPVTAGRPYVVGEHEPEVFVPPTNGTILNQQQLKGLAGSQSTVNDNRTYYITLPPERARGFTQKRGRREMADAMVSILR